MWLFGQLDTLGESTLQQRTDENAKVVAGLLQQLVERQQAPNNGADENREANGDMTVEA